MISLIVAVCNSPWVLGELQHFLASKVLGVLWATAEYRSWLPRLLSLQSCSDFLEAGTLSI